MLLGIEGREVGADGLGSLLHFDLIKLEAILQIFWFLCDGFDIDKLQCDILFHEIGGIYGLQGLHKLIVFQNLEAQGFSAQIPFEFNRDHELVLAVEHNTDDIVKADLKQLLQAVIGENDQSLLAKTKEEDGPVFLDHEELGDRNLMEIRNLS